MSGAGFATITSNIWNGWKGQDKTLNASMKIKRRLPDAPPPTKAVDIGKDKLTFIPAPEKKETDKKGWSARDERIVAKLKAGGMKDKEIAKKTGRTLYSVKWKIKELRRAGQL